MEMKTAISCTILRHTKILIAVVALIMSLFFFSSRRRHTRFDCDWSSDVCSSDLSWARRGEHGRRALSAEFCRSPRARWEKRKNLSAACPVALENTFLLVKGGCQDRKSVV